MYDQIAPTYVSTRRPHPRIAAAIKAAVGDADSIVNVGAGTGAYERVGKSMIAVDLESGVWEKRFGHLRSLDALDAGYRLLATR